VAEETGLRVEPRDVVLVFDRIHRDGGRVSYHYVIVDYACDYVSGTLRAGSDAQDAAFVAEGDLPNYDVPEQALDLVRKAFERRRLASRPPTR
jgi:8-oxo-dGTP diphosphatase